MANGILSRLPDLSAVTQIGASMQSGIEGLVGVLQSLPTGQPPSPLASVSGSIGGLQATVSIDVSGLTQRFPQALDTIVAAVPSASVDFVRSIEAAYAEARSFLGDSALAKEIGEGRSLQEAALAAVAAILRGFDDRFASLQQNLIDPGTLAAVTDTFAQLAGFLSDFDAHRADFLPFLSRNLLGVPPDLLHGALGNVTASLAVLNPLDPESVRAAIGSASEGLDAAFRALASAVEGMDPADPGVYTRITGQLDALESAIGALTHVLEPPYAAARSAIDSHAWDTIFSAHRTLLEAISFDPALSVDDLVASMAGILEGLFAGLQAVFGPADLVERIGKLTHGIQDAFASSPLGQIRQSIREFLERIQHAIEAVPLDGVEEAVESMLGRVRQEIESLGLTQVQDTIEQGFRRVETFVNDQINDLLRDRVRDALQGLAGGLGQLPVDTLVDSLNQVVAQVGQVVQDVEAALRGAFDKLSDVAAQLDDLSFEPVGDAVVGEINDLKARLDQIDPNALSDVEKLALKGALAVVRAIDLEGFIEREVKAGFHAAQDALTGLLDQVAAALGAVRDRIDRFRPDQLTGAVTGVLEQAKQSVDGLRAAALMKPLYDAVEALTRRLDAISPGALLEPLEGPFRTVRSAVDQLNPDQLISPLRSLYAEIDGLIDRVDVTPLLDELDRRQKDLFATARNSMLSSLDALSLPEPLAGFLAAMRPALEAMTDAIFENPGTELRRLSVDLAGRFRLSSLFAPLDDAFDRLVGLLGSVPEADLVAAVNGIRTAVVVGLDTVDPHRMIEALRAGRGLLAGLSPRILLGVALQLPSLRVAFEVRAAGAPAPLSASVTATLARFSAVAALVDPSNAASLITPLVAAHDACEAALNARVSALDPSGAEIAYGRLRQGLDRVVPAFLRSSDPLGHTEILAGIRSLRPSAAAAPLDAVFERVLAHLKPMQEALEPAIEGFFGAIRDTLMLVNPLSLKDAVADIYTALRTKLRVLDPEQLAASLHTAIFDPVTSALDAVDPAKLRDRLDAAFQSAIGALTTNVKGILDQIAAVLDEQLRALKAAVASVIGRIESVIEEAVRAFEGILDRLEHLVFTEVLDRLRRLVETLGVSFDREVDRVRSAFDEMLAAIPLGDGAPVSVEVSA